METEMVLRSMDRERNGSRPPIEYSRLAGNETGYPRDLIETALAHGSETRLSKPNPIEQGARRLEISLEI